MSDYTDRDRLRDIVRCFVACHQELEATSIGVQFKYETGREATEEEIARAIQREGKR